LAVLCALASALLYAFASVLQQRGAAGAPAEQALRLGLLTRLARNPAWVLGVICDVAGYAAQWVALGRGTLVVVQPLLVCGLLFALPIGAWWAGRQLRPRDWMAAVAVCAGLALFLTMAHPAPGHDNVAPHVWAGLLLSTTAVSLGLVALSRGRPARTRAVLLSGAAGISYGAAAALTKTCSHLLSGGVPVLMRHWQPYALVVIGLGGMVVAQSAFQAGSLDASLPTMTVADPVVSIVIGAVAFGESIVTSPGRTTVEVLALVAMAWGVFALARAESDQPAHCHPPSP
jgi:drug/metabolite transporter (DMT)-like permease